MVVKIAALLIRRSNHEESKSRVITMMFRIVTFLQAIKRFRMGLLSILGYRCHCKGKRSWMKHIESECAKMRTTEVSWFVSDPN